MVGRLIGGLLAVLLVPPIVLICLVFCLIFLVAVYMTVGMFSWLFMFWLGIPIYIMLQNTPVAAHAFPITTLFLGYVVCVIWNAINE